MAVILVAYLADVYRSATETRHVYNRVQGAAASHWAAGQPTDRCSKDRCISSLSRPTGAYQGAPGVGGNPLGQFIGDSAPFVKDRVSEIMIKES